MTHPLVKFALGMLALSSIACGMLQQQQQARADATATSLADQIYGTQTANAPTVTPTATATDTATPTATSTATITPTATATPLPDVSDVVLRPADAGENFESFSRQAIQQQETALSEDEDNLPFGSYSGLLREDQNESLVAYVVYLNTEDARSDFNDALQDPEGIVRSVAVGRKADLLETAEIEGLDELGDSSNGTSSVMRLEDGTRLNFDVIIFRRGIIGVFLYDFYVGRSDVTLADIAAILDGRAVEVVGD